MQTVELETNETELQQVKSMMTSDTPLPAVLGRLITILEERCPGTSAAVLTLQDGFFDVVAPSFDAEFVGSLERDAIAIVCHLLGYDAPLDECGLVCITDQATVLDIGPLAMRRALPFCWATLVYAAGQLFAAIVIFRREPHQPDEQAVSLIEFLKHLAAIAAERKASVNDGPPCKPHDESALQPDRMMLEHHLAQASVAASPQYPSAFLLIDLDDFRSVNHALGHGTGDVLLAQVSRRLHEAVENDDAFGYMGGDEFGFVLHGLHDVADAVPVARRLLAAMEAPFHVEGRELRISASIGISVCPNDGTDVSDMRRCAEIAMYCVKQQGRNGFQFYAPTMIAGAEEHITLAGDLRHAIERNELELHYQPQVTPKGELIGFEALLRWHHPIRGNVPPSLFIPIAEASGVILSIGHWVLLEACRQCSAWQTPGEPPVKVAVNISVAQFLQSDFYGGVIGAIKRFGVAPGCLELEITESLVVVDNRAAAEKLAALRSAGVRIAVDDFGTGYSSLAYLQQLPIDSLKIDRSFVSAITAATSKTGRRSAIVRAVTTLARDLGLSVTAEGVETPEQQKYLSEIGCHHLQGYLFGKPQPAQHAQFLLEQYRQSRAGSVQSNWQDFQGIRLPTL